MRNEQEIIKQIEHLEQQQKKAFCKCEYALWDSIDIEIKTLKWVLTESKVKL